MAQSRANAVIKKFSFANSTVWNVKLARDGLVARHFHANNYVVHPLKSGQVRVTMFRDAAGQTLVSEEVKTLVAGEPYEVIVPPPGLWVELVNEGDDTEWDKDEPTPP